MAKRSYLFRASTPPNSTPSGEPAFINITIIKYTAEVVKIAWGFSSLGKGGRASTSQIFQRQPFD